MFHTNYRCSTHGRTSRRQMGASRSSNRPAGPSQRRPRRTTDGRPSTQNATQDIAPGPGVSGQLQRRLGGQDGGCRTPVAASHREPWHICSDINKLHNFHT